MPASNLAGRIALALCIVPAAVSAQLPAAAWRGVLQDSQAHPLAGAYLTLSASGKNHTAVTAADGTFSFPGLLPGTYTLAVRVGEQVHTSAAAISVPAATASVALTLTRSGAITISVQQEVASAAGEPLTSKVVSEIPLNKRDFSQILLLAAGTSSDSSGAANFTQQFAINGQRGVEATFALDGADISDPEVGGGTFTNFNVDAILELQSLSGVMPAEIGRGASGFTNILTRSGTDKPHGSVFEFLRNSSLDARNYFDHPSPVSPGRIPPFRRNEFGFTNGGPVIIPHLMNGKGRLFYFGEYQGFRQVLGTTQILAVPTAQQRAGQDSTAFTGDVLNIPVDPGIAKVLSRYPLPNYPSGTFGANTFATSSKVITDADQFSVRFDLQPSAHDHVFLRATFDNLSGPEVNPDQTVLDPSFGVDYHDRQRNGVLTWVHTASPRTSFESSVNVTRTTPAFVTPNQTDPAIKFNDSLFEPFNAPGGTVTKSFGNLFQARANVTLTRSHHALVSGVDIRLNRDSTYFGPSPNGEYDFGGGTAYAPYAIASQSGTHNLRAGDPLPDTLSALLVGSPFVYTRAVAPPYFSNGERIGPAADSRSAFEVYAQDVWKLGPRFTLDYGLRYELYTPFTERAHRNDGLYPTADGGQEYLINPDPVFRTNMNNWGPRLGADYRVTDHTRAHLAGGLTTIPPNLTQTNFSTGGLPAVLYPRVTATASSQVRYGYAITPNNLPPIYTPGGLNIYGTYAVKDVPPNTPVDINRLEQDIADAENTQSAPLNVGGIARDFGNAGLATWTASLEQAINNVTLTAAYVGTAAWKLPRVSFPNAYAGATAQFARYTTFDSTGTALGGFGTESVITASSHSSYHALQLSGQGQTGRGGPGFQASYTWSKSIDDSSTVGGTSVTSTVGAITQAPPQNPFDTHPERGPSTYDTTNAFSLSLTQDLPVAHTPGLARLNRKLVGGWQLISVSTLSGGTPFTVYSGVQQTGVGAGNVDRPDQVATPQLSTARSKREDYFGRGENNGSFFSIPINLPGGTGPNAGRFGTLGRNTFRGPAFYNFDISLVKDTSFGHRASGSELITMQFRSEFFNIFNIVNMGLPSNTIAGAGFGEINRTAGNSRQIQFSLKIAY